MNFLSKLAAQGAAEFRSLTPPARITAGLLVAAVLVCVGLLMNQQVASADAYLMNGEPIAAGQMPVMEAAFAKAGLNDYLIEGNRIKIPRGKNSQYMGAMADAGALPANFGSFFDNMLKQSGPFVSRSQQEEMIKVARQHELALIIQSMKGYERAAVLYDTQKKSGLHGGEIMTASVNVKPVGNLTLNRDQVSSLRNLLAGAIAGLEPRNVAVTDLNSGRTYYASDDESLSSSDSYVTRKQDYERLWGDKLRQSLEMIPNVIVTVNVELDPDMLNEQTTVEYDKRSPQPSASGPLADALAFTRRATAAPGDDPNGPGTRRTTVHRVPLRPMRATVAVGIPSSYLEQVWRHQHPAAQQAALQSPDAKEIAALQSEVIAKVENQVRMLLPNDVDKAHSQLSVTATVFQDIADKVTIAEPELSGQVFDWMGRHDTLLALCGFMAVGLLMLRSFGRGAQAAAPAAQPLIDQTESQNVRPATPHTAPTIEFEPAEPVTMTFRTDEAETTVAAPLTFASAGIMGAETLLDDRETLEEADAMLPPARRPAAGPPLRDQLAAIVRDDPDAAARILRTWIGSST